MARRPRGKAAHAAAMKKYRAKLREEQPEVDRQQMDAKNEAARERYRDPAFGDSERARRRTLYAEKKAQQQVVTADAGSLRPDPA